LNPLHMKYILSLKKIFGIIICNQVINDLKNTQDALILDKLMHDIYNKYYFNLLGINQRIKILQFTLRRYILLNESSLYLNGISSSFLQALNALLKNADFRLFKPNEIDSICFIYKSFEIYENESKLRGNFFSSCPNEYNFYKLARSKKCSPEKIGGLYLKSNYLWPKKLRYQVSFYLLNNGIIDDKELPRWDDIRSVLNGDISFEFSYFFLKCLVFYKNDIEEIIQIYMELYKFENKITLQQWISLFEEICKQCTWLGRSDLLLKCTNTSAFDNLQPYQLLGKNKPVEALSAFRRRTLYSLFQSKKISKDASDKSVAVVPSTLAGEIQESFFWKILHEQGVYLNCICDLRLVDLFSRNMKNHNFIGHIPVREVRKQAIEGTDIVKKNEKFFDKKIYEFIGDSSIILPDYNGLYSSLNGEKYLNDGWLVPDPTRVAHILKILEGFRRPFIGVSLNSSMSNGSRQLFGAQISGKITGNSTLIALSPLKDFPQNYQLNMQIVDTGLDLYNDFEGLVALLSILDVTVVPGNNLMEFSAAVGVNSFVISPLETIKSWLNVDTNSYFMSNKLKPYYGNNLIEAVEQAEQFASS
jgi:hypothetical protein